MGCSSSLITAVADHGSGQDQDGTAEQSKQSVVIHMKHLNPRHPPHRHYMCTKLKTIPIQLELRRLSRYFELE